MGLLERFLLSFTLSLILILQIFSVTQFGDNNSNITRPQNVFAQTSGNVKQSYTLYQNDNEGVSIEYPSDWTYSEKTQGERMVTSFSPYQNSPTLVQLFYDKNTFYVGTDQQKLERLPGIISKICSGATFAKLGFTCSDFQYKTGITKYRGIPAYVMASSMRQTFSDGSTREQDMTQFLVLAQNSNYGIIVSCPKDECDNHSNEISHFVNSLNIYSVKAAASDYSNYSLLQGEWVKYKMYLKVESSDNSLQQQMQDALTQQFSSLAGQQLKSLDDMDWIKSTIASVSTNAITTHNEVQVLGKPIDIGDSDLKKSPSTAISTNSKVGDVFDSPLSSPDNPSKLTLTAIKLENILGTSVKVYELTSSETTPGTMAIEKNQIVHYDTKTGILLDWILGMKIYNSTKSVNVQLGVIPIEWSQMPVTPVQTPVYNIPSWIKNTAKWWSEGQVEDSDFVHGIQYLVQQGIIEVPTTQVGSQTSQTIPSWVKNTTKWWSEGQVEDSDFVHGIQYLVQSGIIVTQSGEQQNSTGILSGAIFYTGESSQPQNIVYTDEKGNQVSMFAIPRQALLLVPADTPLNTVSSMITNNGGVILSQIPKIGVYLVQVDDIANFISSARQSSFVDYVGPNGVESISQAQGVNLKYQSLKNKDDWKNVQSPDPRAKVLLVQIDNFHDPTGLCGASHGECVSKQSDPESKGISVLRLDTDLTGKNIAENIRYAALIAETNKQKLVINLSLGQPVTDKNGKVIVSDPIHTLEEDTKFYLAAAMGTESFKNHHMVITKSAGNDGQDLSQETKDLGSDSKYQDTFKILIKTGEVDIQGGSVKLAEYEKGTTSNHGEGVVYTTSNEICQGGTSCTTYTTATNLAYIWSLHPDDINSEQIVDITKKTASYSNSGSYPIISLKSAYDQANEVSNCAPNCLLFGATTNGGGTTTSGGSQQQSQQQAEQEQQMRQMEQMRQQQQQQQTRKYSSGESYCQGTYGAKYHYDASTNKCVSYGGYDSKESYCKGTYGTNYYYDSSQDLCVSSTGGGTSSGSDQGASSGTSLSGTWEGTAKGSAVFNDNSGQITCQFAGHISLVLTQSGNSLNGDVEVSGISLSGDGCEAYSISQVGGQLSSTIFGSGFSGTVDFLNVNGQFTSDLMRGTYSGNGGGYTISGDFTASRAR